ncbi:MAG TPA: response regulator [Terriglobales bacterium]|nr:response regulator [Terriglobales bacterium]
MLDRKKTLLLIDDDFKQLVLRKRVLELSGFTVVAAGNAQRGMQLLEAETPDAVVLDYEMPKMTGDVLASNIRRANGAIPIVMLSGSSVVPSSALTAVDAFLSKATHPSVLLETIESLVQAQEVFA